jgi:hypothetical protein
MFSSTLYLFFCKFCVLSGYMDSFFLNVAGTHKWHVAPPMPAHRCFLTRGRRPINTIHGLLTTMCGKPKRRRARKHWPREVCCPQRPRPLYNPTAPKVHRPSMMGNCQWCSMPSLRPSQRGRTSTARGGHRSPTSRSRRWCAPPHQWQPPQRYYPCVQHVENVDDFFRPARHCFRYITSPLQRRDDLYAIPASVDDADVSGPQGHATGVGHRPTPLVCSVPML